MWLLTIVLSLVHLSFSFQASGNKILYNGNPVTFRGVDRSGSEFACVQNNGIFDGPTDLTSIAVIKGMRLNECLFVSLSRMECERCASAVE
jgi:hypothetical protein